MLLLLLLHVALQPLPPLPQTTATEPSRVCVYVCVYVWQIHNSIRNMHTESRFVRDRFAYIFMRNSCRHIFHTGRLNSPALCWHARARDASRLVTDASPLCAQRITHSCDANTRKKKNRQHRHKTATTTRRRRITHLFDPRIQPAMRFDYVIICIGTLCIAAGEERSLCCTVQPRAR